MKKTFLFWCFLLIAAIAQSQHYYKDILSIQAAAQKHKLHRENKVKSVRFLSFDADNQPIEGFSSEQNFTKDFAEVTTTTTTSLSGSTFSQSLFNNNNQLIKTLDTSDGVKTITTYNYDSNNQLTGIANTTTSAGDFSIQEIHQWQYNNQGKPVKMLKIKNGKDTTLVDFVLDEKGNISEEKSMIRGRVLPTVFYYYNEDNQLTDIVRYNRVAKRLLPDYVFEYDEKNRIGSMLVVPEEGSEYQKWYYSYDEDGLKILDACYSKTKTLIARVEYQYQYY